MIHRTPSQGSWTTEVHGIGWHGWIQGQRSIRLHKMEKDSLRQKPGSTGGNMEHGRGASIPICASSRLRYAALNSLHCTASCARRRRGTLAKMSSLNSGTRSSQGKAVSQLASADIEFYSQLGSAPSGETFMSTIGGSLAKPALTGVL
jgi:hypothetical protein